VNNPVKKTLFFNLVHNEIVFKKCKITIDLCTYFFYLIIKKKFESNLIKSNQNLKGHPKSETFVPPVKLYPGQGLKSPAPFLLD